MEQQRTNDVCTAEQVQGQLESELVKSIIEFNRNSGCIN